MSASGHAPCTSNPRQRSEKAAVVRLPGNLVGSPIQKLDAQPCGLVGLIRQGVLRGPRHGEHRARTAVALKTWSQPPALKRGPQIDARRKTPGSDKRLAGSAARAGLAKKQDRQEHRVAEHPTTHHKQTAYRHDKVLSSWRLRRCGSLGHDPWRADAHQQSPVSEVARNCIANEAACDSWQRAVLRSGTTDPQCQTAITKLESPLSKENSDVRHDDTSRDAPAMLDNRRCPVRAERDLAHAMAAQPRSHLPFTMDLNCGSIGVRADQRESIELAARYGFESVMPDPGFLARLSDAQNDELLAELKEQNVTWGAAGLPVEFRRDDAAFQSGLQQLPPLARALQRRGDASGDLADLRPQPVDLHPQLPPARRPAAAVCESPGGSRPAARPGVRRSQDALGVAALPLCPHHGGGQGSDRRDRAGQRGPGSGQLALVHGARDGGRLAPRLPIAT